MLIPKEATDSLVNYWVVGPITWELGINGIFTRTKVRTPHGRPKELVQGYTAEAMLNFTKSLGRTSQQICQYVRDHRDEITRALRKFKEQRQSERNGSS